MRKFNLERETIVIFSSDNGPWDEFGNHSGEVTYRRIDWALFDLENDPYETTNLIEQHPDVVAGLKAYAEMHRQKFDLK